MKDEFVFGEDFAFLFASRLIDLSVDIFNYFTGTSAMNNLLYHCFLSCHMDLRGIALLHSLSLQFNHINSLSGLELVL
jgi:hypothetical protein